MTHDDRAPLVSLVIPAFNAEPFIANAVDSARRQTLDSWELIIVDDCSSDGTTDLVRRLADEDARIRLIRSARNQGPAAARNTGFAAARGIWIAILDADDSYVESRLELLVATADRHGLDIIADNQIFHDSGAGLDVRTAFDPRRPHLDWNCRTHLEQELSGWDRDFPAGLLKPMFRSDFLRRHNIAYDASFRMGEDFLLYWNVLMAGAKGLIISEPMYRYTLPFSTMSNAHSGTSRTGNKFADVLRAYEAVENSCRPRQQSSELALISDLKRRVRAEIRYAEARRAIRQRRLGPAIDLLKSDPQFFAKTFRNYIRRRLQKPHRGH